MSPDPFRALDHIDPPDHWDEIARRSATEDIDVDLDIVRAIRPRRRATVLVAAAAVIALVAGVAISAVGDDGGSDGVTATSTPDAIGMDGPCPFRLDPDTVVPPLVPQTGRPPVPAYTRTWRQPEGTDLSVPGSWGTLDDAGIPVTVSVLAAVASPQASGTTAVLPDDPDDPHVVEVVAWGPFDGATDACPTAEVRVRLPLTEEDRDRQASGEEVSTTGYLTHPVPSRILDAVRLAPAAEGAGCSFTLDDPSLPALTAKADDEEAPFQLLDGLTADWRRAEVGSARVFVGVGAPTGGPLQDPGERWTADEASYDTGARRAVVQAYEGLAPDGSCTSAAVFVAFPLTDEEVEGIDTGRLAGPDITDEAALAGRVLDALEVATSPDEGEAPETSVPTGPVTTTDPPPTSSSPTPGGEQTAETTPPQDEMTWEGPTADGRTYRVEIDGDTTRGFIDDVLYGEAPGSTPSWTDPMRSAGLWFSRDVPGSDGDDAVIVAAVPPGAVETTVVDAAGNPVAAPTLTFSPDGRFYALHAADLRPPVANAEAPWVRHRAADGSLFPVVPAHDR